MQADAHKRMEIGLLCAALSITSNCRLALFHQSATLHPNALDLALGKISINALRGKLYLLGMLPSKDGSGVVKQMRIPLGLFDAPADLKIAEKRRNQLLISSIASVSSMDERERGLGKFLIWVA